MFSRIIGFVVCVHLSMPVSAATLGEMMPLKNFSFSPHSSQHVDFSPDGSFMALSDSNAQARLINLRDGSITTLDTHPSTTFCKWSPSGKYLVVLDFYAAIVYDGKSGEQLFYLPSWKGGRIAFSDDERYFAVTGYTEQSRKFVNIFDFKSASSALVVQQAEGNLQFTRDSKKLIIAPGYLTPGRVIDLEARKEILSTGFFDKVGYFAAKVSSDGRYILSPERMQDQRLNVFNTLTGNSIQIEGNWNTVISPDSARVITTFQGKLRVYDISSGRLLFENSESSSGDLGRAVFGKSGAELVLPFDGHLQVLDLASLNLKTILVDGNGGPVHNLAYLGHDRVLSMSEYGYMKEIDLSRASVIAEYPFRAGYAETYMSQNNRFLFLDDKELSSAVLFKFTASP